MKHRPLLSSLLLGGLAALLALPCGCGERKPAAGEATGPTIGFAYQDRIADAASIIAVEKQLFAEEGLAVKTFVFSSGPACSEALLTASADIGTMGDTTAVIAAARSPVKIVASHGGGEHRHRIIVAADSPVRSPADLVGRSIAVKKGTSTYGGLLAWADSLHLDLSKVKVTDMRPQDMADALLSGAIDAIVASEPTPSLVEERGGRELATLGGLGNTYPILLVARDEFLANHKDAATRFMRAMDRAAAFIADNPEEAAAIVARKTGLSQATAERAMTHHYYGLQLDDTTMASLQKIADFLVAQKTLDSPPSLPVAVDDRYLPEAR
ncbi:MAG: ABC transporter substrate-binding protein [Armatimonadota bacterium]|nr:MAG: ABC transporter substrate-binding protein [Armatimonadota bacterium]